MYDPETYSYWSHLLGKAMTGPMEGAELDHVPSVMTDWGSWKERHPDTTVLWLPRTVRNYQRSFYGSLDRFVLGIAEFVPPHAWRFDDLMKHPIVNDQYLETPVVIAFDQDSMTARMFGREFRGQTLHFERDAHGFIDRESRSLWDRVTGKCLTGHYKGERLKVMPAIVSYRKPWMAFHPDTVIKRQP